MPALLSINKPAGVHPLKDACGIPVQLEYAAQLCLPPLWILESLMEELTKHFNKGGFNFLVLDL